MSEKRNIVIITLDSLRADHCSFMGYERKTTPFIDKMARKGLYFENAMAASIATSPSMFTALTGEYPLLESNNYNPNDWRKEISLKETISEKLLKQGYYTAAFSPNIAFSGYFGFSKGFCYFDDFSKHEKFRSHEAFQKIGSTKLTRFFIYLYDILTSKGEAVNWEDIYMYILNKIKEFPKPYFVWILLLDTHIPYLPPKKYRKWGNLAHIIYSNYLAYQGPLSSYVERTFHKFIDARNIYDDCIYYADSFVKNLFNDLSNDDPVFIIHGDHGEGFGEHGYYGHPPGYPVYLYEEFIHIPFVIYNADLKGKFEKPTSLKYLHLIVNNIVNTERDLSFLDNNWVVTLVLDRGKIKIAVRTKHWKLITGQKTKCELYNLKLDPCERNNLSDSEIDIFKELEKVAARSRKYIIEMKKLRNRKKIRERFLKTKI